MAYEEKTDWLPDDPINEDDVNRWEKGIKDAHTDLAAHKNDMNNPHKTTKAQIGLGNVDNVQQAAKKDFDQHNQDQNRHVTIADKDKWNAGQLFKITADNGTQKINLTSGSFYESLKDVGSVTFYGTNAVTDNPSDTSLRGMQLVGQPGIGNGYAVDVKGNAWWFYYNSNQTAINWYPIESIAGAQSKVDAHASDSSIHISSVERDKWNGGQLAKLTKDDGKRTRLESGSDILALSSGFYYGMGAQLKNNPVENDNSLFNYDVIESDSGKSILAWRSYDNNVWIATVHTDGVFKGWKRLFTEEEFNKMTWYDLTLINGHKAGARNPQYAVWGNQVFTRGEVVPPDFDSVFAVLPSEAHPSTQKSMAAPLFGTTGMTKYYAEPTGELRFNGKYAKIEANITGISIDNNFTL
ncbi:hypothetical protein JD965_06980 [Bacillus siamensis]|uniref:hypothetical protein n=1 Tax=Bacillus siamensis TaxID=659243 RepID=UPI0018E63BC6|nr:hypothetical protein [Bacillus siamensis]QQD83314.1 hypothetical protein JD965_06980 [Bacillus siamensis]